MINLLSELVILVTHVTALTKDILCRPHVECVVQAENRILLPIQITIRPPFALSITPPSSWGIAPPSTSFLALTQEPLLSDYITSSSALLMTPVAPCKAILHPSFSIASAVSRVQPKGIILFAPPRVQK